jgi:hypothetical protein
MFSTVERQVHGTLHFQGLSCCSLCVEEGKGPGLASFIFSPCKFHNQMMNPHIMFRGACITPLMQTRFLPTTVGASSQEMVLYKALNLVHFQEHARITAM